MPSQSQEIVILYLLMPNKTDNTHYVLFYVCIACTVLRIKFLQQNQPKKYEFLQKWEKLHVLSDEH